MKTPSAGVIEASPPLPLSPRPPARSNGLLRQASSTSTVVRAPHCARVVDGGLQPPDVLIGVVADQESDALLRLCGGGEAERKAQRQDREA